MAFVITKVVAQQGDSVFVGTATGIIWDSSHNYVLPSATVAVYKEPETELINYQLTNNMGEFNFKNLPINRSLKVIVSYSGYAPCVIEFSVPSKTGQVHLKRLNMKQEPKTLPTITVTAVPPVRMNGDTLEFNADAFKLDRNAVVEDLMRKLPGVTIWADGMITVNGRKVNNLFVEGKRFFGNDPKIALQNLPKSSVDKIQVYKRQKDEQQSPDSLTDINVKLKKDKSVGIFGKIAAGYGSDDKYEADAALNSFSPKTQIAIVGASNNVNKHATDINMLQRNASYKGVGASNEYQPDFRAQGQGQQHAGGISYEHNFIDGGNEYDLKNAINATYYLRNNRDKYIKNNQTTTYLGSEGTLTQDYISQQIVAGIGHKFESKYNWIKDRENFYLNPTFNSDNVDDRNDYKSTSVTSEDMQSFSNSSNEQHTSSKNLLLETGYKQNRQSNRGGRQPSEFQIDYTFSARESNNIQNRKSEFFSVMDKSQNRIFNRNYNQQINTTGQTIYFKFGDLRNVLFGNINFAGIRMLTRYQHSLKTEQDNNIVHELDTVSKQFQLNRYLTNKNKYITHNEVLGLSFVKMFGTELANRYQKSISIELTPKVQFFAQKNTSQKEFQFFNKQHWNFVPEANINYYNNQTGAFQTNYSLAYAISTEYPSLNQLAPLVDSSSIWYLQFGNLDLKPSRKTQLQFGLSHNSLRQKNVFLYQLTLSIGEIKNAIIDSSVYDREGRSVHYPVNSAGNRYLNFNSTISKAFRSRDHQIQVNLSPSLGLNRRPGYVNNTLYVSNDLTTNAAVRIAYSLGDWLALNLDQGLAWYQAVQKSASEGDETKNTFRNTYRTTGVSANIKWRKRFTIGSNINYNRIGSDVSNSIQFAIWNANLACRLFKENSAEVKLSAFDLLRQNINVINGGRENVLTRETVNMLQQYFMLTLSWYPRKFGASRKLKYN